MNRRKAALALITGLVVVALGWGAVSAGAAVTRDGRQRGSTKRAQKAWLAKRIAQVQRIRDLRVTQDEREAAAVRLRTKAGKALSKEQRELLMSGAPLAQAKLAATALALLPNEPVVGQGDVPDHFGLTVPNWAYTPAIRKFVDTLPMVGPGGANNLGQYIPVAVPDTASYKGPQGGPADYYEIAVVQYTQQFHSDLPETTLRGYVQIDTPELPDTPTKTALTYPDGSPILDAQGQQVYAVDEPRYLGPMILADKNRAVRIKFTNYLPKTAQGGDLFVPVDTTVMGAGMGPNMAMPMHAMPMGMGTMVEIMTMEPHTFKVGQKVMMSGFAPDAYNGEFRITDVPDDMHFHVELKSDPMGPATTLGEVSEMYTENRAVSHLHGGLTPWISDGTPHQWITPAGENTNYPRGVSVSNVPDMADPGDGSTTLYYTNQQSARLMWFHDHVYGITRLNVYVGEAAPYLIEDGVERDLVANNILPADQIPLIIQDKTFVDAETTMDPLTIADTDPTWRWGTGADTDGNGYPDYKTGDLWVPHVYVPAQNPADLSGMNPMGRWHYGPWFWPPTANIKYPPKPNPYYDPDLRPWEPEFMPATPDPSMGMEHYNDTPIVNGAAYPTLTVDPKAYRFRILNAANDRFFNLQWYLADPTVTTADGRTGTEVKMVPAVAHPGDPTWPELWPTDGREGGVPDPTTVGPDWLQVGTEGGFLPNPVVVPNQPVTWNGDPTTFNMGNVQDHSLMLGNAERADVIVDFSQYAGQTLILYNDAPTAFPALDPRTDYYTGMPDMRDTGGHFPTDAGFGPNTRTIMQVVVNPDPVADSWVGQAALEAEWASAPGHPGVFELDQDPILVGQSAYDPAYTRAIGGLADKPFPAFPSKWAGLSSIFSTSLNFETLTGLQLSVPMHKKAIQDEQGETFDQWGRMSGMLGTTIDTPVAPGARGFSLQRYTDPSTENLVDTMEPLTPVLNDGTQIWKITHNGVDTHPIHFHHFNVQLINRVGWDNGIRLPDANELGWKETIRVSPLEDTIVALRPYAPKTHFGLPDSIRLLDPTMPEGATWGGFDPSTGDPVTITNTPTNFRAEYMWHCHILSHEEMEMMRPMVLEVDRQLPFAPELSVATADGNVVLTWVDRTAYWSSTSLGNPRNEVGYRVERAVFGRNGKPGPYEPLGSALANATTYTDLTAAGRNFSYRVIAYNAAGTALSNPVSVGAVDLPPSAPANLTLVRVRRGMAYMRWTDTSANELGFIIERSSDGTTWTTVGQNDANRSDFYDRPPAVGTYSYRIRAFNAVGQSDPSNTIEVVIL
jgi:FtsP/CotA-like multicopper oxidase with cupredoxin domain